MKQISVPLNPMAANVTALREFATQHAEQVDGPPFGAFPRVLTMVAASGSSEDVDEPCSGCLTSVVADVLLLGLVDL